MVINNNNAITPFQEAKKEIDFYQNITKEQWPKFEETSAWWDSKYSQDNLPCLTQDEDVILACKPSSSGLECDLESKKGLSRVRICRDRNVALANQEPASIQS